MSIILSMFRYIENINISFDIDVSNRIVVAWISIFPCIVTPKFYFFFSALPWQPATT